MKLKKISILTLAAALTIGTVLATSTTADAQGSSVSGNSVNSGSVSGNSTSSSTVSGNSVSASTSVSTGSAPSHTHEYEYVVVKAPTESEDGAWAIQCVTCGLVVDYQPISAVAAFLSNTQNTVKNASQNATVTVETTQWLCFNKAIIEAIASRPDVTVTVNYRYQQKNYTVTIPAGYDVMSLLDENGFVGFRYLDLVLGGSEITE